MTNANILIRMGVEGKGGMGMKIDPAVLAALANILPKDAKKGRAALAQGEHEIDAEVTFSIKGQVNVSEDEEYVPTTSIPYTTAFALFVHHSGITGEAAVKALVRAMSEAIAIEGLDKKDHAAKVASIQAIADLEAAEAEVQKGLAALPKAKRAGKVNVKAVVEVVAAGSAVVVEGEAAEGKVA